MATEAQGRLWPAGEGGVCYPFKTREGALDGTGAQEPEQMESVVGSPGRLDSCLSPLPAPNRP